MTLEKWPDLACQFYRRMLPVWGVTNASFVCQLLADVCGTQKAGLFCCRYFSSLSYCNYIGGARSATNPIHVTTPWPDWWGPSVRSNWSNLLITHPDTYEVHLPKYIQISKSSGPASAVRARADGHSNHNPKSGGVWRPLQGF